MSKFPLVLEDVTFTNNLNYTGKNQGLPRLSSLQRTIPGQNFGWVGKRFQFILNARGGNDLHTLSRAASSDRVLLRGGDLHPRSP